MATVVCHVQAAAVLVCAGSGKGRGGGMRAAVVVVARAKQVLTSLRRRWKASLRAMKVESASSSTRVRLSCGADRGDKCL